MNLLSWFKHFLPDYGPFLKMGYKATTFNQDFIFEKEIEDICFIHIHQSLGPFHPLYKNLIDFEIEEKWAYVVIGFRPEYGERHKLIDELREVFDYNYLREDYLFCCSKDLKFNDNKLVSLIQELESTFQSFK